MKSRRKSVDFYPPALYMYTFNLRDSGWLLTNRRETPIYSVGVGPLTGQGISHTVSHQHISLYIYSGAKIINAVYFTLIVFIVVVVPHFIFTVL